MKKILFIDDDEINNFIVNSKLKEQIPELETMFLESAQSGLDYLAENSEDPPRLIFLDVKMPGMDGFDFLDEYHKRMYHETFPTRIYMLSSSVKASDQEKSKDYSSVEGFISKPMEINELKEISQRSSPT